jgi:hypothetical protein
MPKRLRFRFLAFLILTGCQSSRPTAAPIVVPKIDDKSYEILLQHLLHRADAAEGEIGKLKNEIIQHDNRCLEEQIAALEGHPTRTKPQDPMTAQRKLTKDLSDGLSTMVQGLLDSEAVIEEHNKRHPESPWAEDKDILHQMCGDCAKEREVWNAKLATDTQAYENSIRKPTVQ